MTNIVSGYWIVNIHNVLHMKRHTASCNRINLRHSVLCKSSISFLKASLKLIWSIPYCQNIYTVIGCDVKEKTYRKWRHQWAKGVVSFPWNDQDKIIVINVLNDIRMVKCPKFVKTIQFCLFSAYMYWWFTITYSEEVTNEMSYMSPNAGAWGGGGIAGSQQWV